MNTVLGAAHEGELFSYCVVCEFVPTCNLVSVRDYDHMESLSGARVTAY